MEQPISRELRAAIALESAREQVEAAKSPSHDPFGWMTGPNFNPMTKEYEIGPIGAKSHDEPISNKEQKQ